MTVWCLRKAQTETKIAAETEKADRSRQTKHRATTQAKSSRNTSKKSIDTQRLVGEKCYLQSDINDHQKVKADLAERGCTEVGSRAEATVIIADDPSDLGSRSLWTAVVKGLCVASPTFIKSGKGPMIKYKPANRTRRTIYMTPSFTAKHQEIMKTIESGCSDSHSLWKLCHNMDDQYLL